MGGASSLNTNILSELASVFNTDLSLRIKREPSLALVAASVKKTNTASKGTLLTLQRIAEVWSGTVVEETAVSHDVASIDVFWCIYGIVILTLEAGHVLLAPLAVERTGEAVQCIGFGGVLGAVEDAVLTFSAYCYSSCLDDVH